MPRPIGTIQRLLVVPPKWVGDVVMVTPTMRLIRRAHPGAHITAMVKPGCEPLLSGLDLADRIMGCMPGGRADMRATRAIREGGFDAAIILRNSFSSALPIFAARVPVRIGYARDLRSPLLTHRVKPLRDPRHKWRIVPLVDYYYTLAARWLLPVDAPAPMAYAPLPPEMYLEQAATPAEGTAASHLLHRAGVEVSARLAMMNPGANSSTKRWAPERFGAVARHLAERHGMAVLVNGSPAEGAIVDQVLASSGNHPRVLGLPRLGSTLGTFKALVKRSSLMVTNDTGPRHVAAAFGVPLVTLFGPTDPRWTTIPTRPSGPEVIVQADPTLPPEERPEEHPERCSMSKVTVEAAIDAVDRLLERIGASTIEAKSLATAPAGR